MLMLHLFNVDLYMLNFYSSFSFDPAHAVPKATHYASCASLCAVADHFSVSALQHAIFCLASL